MMWRDDKAFVEFMGKREKADWCRGRADHICNSVNRLCKNKDGFYTESPQHFQVSQITNLMAILADAVTGNEARLLMERLLEPKDWFGQVDLFLHLYLFEAMNKTGFQDHFLSELTEWQLMKERGMTTFAEVPLEWGEENQRSECHPWSSSPNYFFFRTICGIMLLEPGHKKVEIAPFFGELKKITAVYPHHSGNIELEFYRDKVELKGKISIPKGMEAVLKWNGKRIKLITGEQDIKI